MSNYKDAEEVKEILLKAKKKIRDHKIKREELKKTIAVQSELIDKLREENEKLKSMKASSYSYRKVELRTSNTRKLSRIAKKTRK